MKFKRETQLPYPQPWEWVRDNIDFEDDKLFFVDVGAHDGVSSSNTGHFEIDLSGMVFVLNQILKFLSS